MPRISSKSREVAVAIGRRENVQTYGALSAENANGLGPWDSGRLAGPDLDQFRADRADICYVVRSYVTPIAWVTRAGRVHKVAQKFSSTTSQHQSKLYLLEDDTHSSASRQHYIDTGEYLKKGESL